MSDLITCMCLHVVDGVVTWQEHLLSSLHSNSTSRQMSDSLVYVYLQVVEDGIVTWYESLIMLITYGFYILIMRFVSFLHGL